MGKRVVLGLTTEVILTGKKSRKLLAKVDTGATGSSIDSKLAQELGLTLIEKTKVVKSASGVGKRSMARGKIKLNHHFLDAEFTLVDRSHLSCPVLVGQNLLKQGCFLIDPHKKLTLKNSSTRSKKS